MLEELIEECCNSGRISIIHYNEEGYINAKCLYNEIISRIPKNKLINIDDEYLTIQPKCTYYEDIIDNDSFVLMLKENHILYHHLFDNCYFNFILFSKHTYTKSERMSNISIHFKGDMIRFSKQRYTNFKDFQMNFLLETRKQKLQKIITNVRGTC